MGASRHRSVARPASRSSRAAAGEGGREIAACENATHLQKPLTMPSEGRLVARHRRSELRNFCGPIRLIAHGQGNPSQNSDRDARRPGARLLLTRWRCLYARDQRAFSTLGRAEAPTGAGDGAARAPIRRSRHSAQPAPPGNRERDQAPARRDGKLQRARPSRENRPTVTHPPTQPQAAAGEEGRFTTRRA